MTKTTCRYAEFNIHRGPLGCEVNINSADAARTLMVKQTPRRYRSLAALLRSALGHRVMIVADGEEWQRSRDAIAPHMRGSFIAREYAPVIDAVAQKIFGELAERSAGSSFEPAPVNIQVESLMRVVLSSVMGHMLFGQTLPVCEAEYLEKTLSMATGVIRGGAVTFANSVLATVMQTLNCSQHQVFLLPRRQRKAIADLICWIGSKIDQARSAGTLPPLLESLMSRYSDRGPTAQRRCVAAECVMLLTAGIETTAAALAFAIAEIAHNPAVYEEVVEEALRGGVTGYGGEALTVQYPHIHRVLQETLRRHTIVPTMLREAQTDQEITATRSGVAVDVKIKRGSVLRYLPGLGNMRPSIWERPHRFDPGRFARPLTTEQKRHYHTFGSGPQSCPGRMMAVTEFILILRAFFARLEIEHKKIEKNIPVERNAMLTIRPVGVTARVRALSRHANCFRTA